jgi:hypothetical protein
MEDCAHSESLLLSIIKLNGLPAGAALKSVNVQDNIRGECGLTKGDMGSRSCIYKDILVTRETD